MVAPTSTFLKTFWRVHQSSLTSLEAVSDEASSDEKEAHRKQSAKILKEMFAPNFTRAVLELVTSDEAREQLATTLQGKAPCFTDEFETASVECMAAMVRGQILDPSRFQNQPDIDPATRKSASAMIELAFAKIIGGDFARGKAWLCSPAMGRVGQLLLGARPTGDNAKTVTLSTGGRSDNELRAGVLRFLDLIVKDGHLSSDSQRKELVLGCPTVNSVLVERVNRTIDSLEEWLRASPSTRNPTDVNISLTNASNSPVLKLYKDIPDAALKEDFMTVLALTIREASKIPACKEFVEEADREFFVLHTTGKSVLSRWLDKQTQKHNSRALDDYKNYLSKGPTEADAAIQAFTSILPLGSREFSLPFGADIDRAITNFHSTEINSSKTARLPRDVLTADTVGSILRLLGVGVFEVDIRNTTAKCISQPGSRVSNLKKIQMADTAASQEDTSDIVIMSMGAAVGPGADTASTLAAGVAAQAQATLTGATLARTTGSPGGSPDDDGTASSKKNSLMSSVPSLVEDNTNEAEDLVDLLLKEILSRVPASARKFRPRPRKISKGVYKFGLRDVSLFTRAGSLYVSHIDGIAAKPQYGETEVSAASFVASEYGVKDAAGLENLTDLLRPASFGLQRQQLLPGASSSVLPGVPSTSSSTNVASQSGTEHLVRRTIDWKSFGFLYRLVKLGMDANDPQWQALWDRFSANEGLKTPARPRKQKLETLQKFVEQSLVYAVRKDWAKELLYKKPGDPDPVIEPSDDDESGAESKKGPAVAIRRKDRHKKHRRHHHRSRSSSHSRRRSKSSSRPSVSHSGDVPPVNGGASPPPFPGFIPPTAPVPPGHGAFYKTRLCPLFQSGACPRGQSCSYAHGPQELRPNVSAGGRPGVGVTSGLHTGTVMPTAKVGDSVTLSGTGSGGVMDGGATSIPMGTAPPNNPYYKTRMCQAFQQGLCQKGAFCNYAHGAEEMAYYAGGVSGVLAGAGGDLPKGAVSANDIRLAEKRRFEKKRHHHSRSRSYSSGASSRSSYSDSSDGNGSSSEDETDRRIRELQQRLGLGHNGTNNLQGDSGPMGPTGSGRHGYDGAADIHSSSGS
ncbi:hypothetical protein FOZ60_011898 [Perkinsus olseni]|uniref:C3H1-type domain-containing protein n=1 Tax=Perkinsus olseni TaxID=32597 RepID=A0A7J6PAB5_PEROL|nr:hypothetical protein FOZ60_011898 [Perkinsus olseni]